MGTAPYLCRYNVVGLVQVFGDDTFQVTTEFGGGREKVETDSDHFPAFL
jgi:hypothetical protein